MKKRLKDRLLNIMLAQYVRIYVVDIPGDRIEAQMHADSSGEFIPDPVPEISFFDYMKNFCRANLDHAYWAWFEASINPDNMRYVLRGKESYELKCPLKGAGWRMFEVRRYEMRNGDPVRALIGVCKNIPGEEPVTITDAPEMRTEFERYLTALQNDLFMKGQYEGALSTETIANFEVDVTDSKVLRSSFKNPDVFVPVPGMGNPGSLRAMTTAWSRRMDGFSVEEYLHFMSSENLSASYENGITAPSIEYRITDRNLKKIWLRQTVLLTRDDMSGHIMGLMSVRDITESKEIEEENRRRLDIIDGMTREYVFLDLVNLRTEQHLLYRFSDELRKKYLEVLLPKYSDAMEAYCRAGVFEKDREEFLRIMSPGHIREALKGKKELSFRYRALTDRGVQSYRCKIVKIGEVWSDPEEVLVGLANVQNELDTELKQKIILESALEKAREAEKAKTIFLSNMSHDIRTPLNAIIGFATLARLHSEDKKEVDESISRILESGEQLLILINNILDISRIESGRMELNEEPCSLRELIDGIHVLFQPEIERKKLFFHCEIDSAIEDKVYCDNVRMTQLFTNLLGNAVKYTEKHGHVEFILRREGNSSSGRMGLLLIVRDDGIGISPKFQSRIFEPFEREDTSLIGRVPGSGLGMPICKAIVDSLGGTISVRSRQGVGTEFIVHFALRLQEDRKKTPGKKTVSKYQVFSETKRFGHSVKRVPRVLLVEDNVMNREIAARLIRHIGYDVDRAEDGEQACDILEHGRMFYDAVLMDIRMPVLDGYAATRQIRKSRDPAVRSVPIIAMTADAFDEDIEKAREAGMNAFISKPVELETLHCVLGEFLNMPETEKEDDRQSKDTEEKKDGLRDESKEEGADGGQS